MFLVVWGIWIGPALLSSIVRRRLTRELRRYGHGRARPRDAKEDRTWTM